MQERESLTPTKSKLYCSSQLPLFIQDRNKKHLSCLQKIHYFALQQFRPERPIDLIYRAASLMSCLPAVRKYPSKEVLVLQINTQ